MSILQQLKYKEECYKLKYKVRLNQIKNKFKMLKVRFFY